MNATLQRIEQTTVVLMNRSEPTLRSEGASVRVSLAFLTKSKRNAHEACRSYREVNSLPVK